VLADEVGSTVTEVSDYRRGSALDTLGVVPAVDGAVFAAGSGEVLDPIDAGPRGVMVVRVGALELADPAGLEAEKEGLRARLMAQKAAQLMRATLNERRRDTVVEVDNELLQRFAPASS
jgi:hypothetical protein